MYRVQIDRSLCSGIGACAELAPDPFEVGKDGLASVGAGSTADPAVLEAAAACSMAAISVFEEKAA